MDANQVDLLLVNKIEQKYQKRLFPEK